RDTPREVHEQRFAGSSFAHHLLQSNTNSQALPLASAQSRALSLLPGTAQRYQPAVAASLRFPWFRVPILVRFYAAPSVDVGQASFHVGQSYYKRPSRKVAAEISYITRC